MKGDPQDVRDLAEDLKGCIQRHPDALKHNPDIQNDLVKVRDNTFKRYAQISEGKTKE